MKLKKILKSFGKNTYNYELLKRIGDARVWKIWKNCVGGYSEAFEVHKVRKIELSDTFKGHCGMIKNGYTHYEKLASNADFGKYGWAFIDRANAEVKFNQLLEE